MSITKYYFQIGYIGHPTTLKKPGWTWPAIYLSFQCVYFLLLLSNTFRLWLVYLDPSFAVQMDKSFKLGYGILLEQKGILCHYYFDTFINIICITSKISVLQQESNWRVSSCLYRLIQSIIPFCLPYPTPSHLVMWFNSFQSCTDMALCIPSFLTNPTIYMQTFCLPSLLANCFIPSHIIRSLFVYFRG